MHPDRVDHRDGVVGPVGNIERLSLRVEGDALRVGPGMRRRRVERRAHGQVAPVAHIGVDHEHRVVLLVGDIDAVQCHVHHEVQGVQVGVVWVRGYGAWSMAAQSAKSLALQSARSQADIVSS